MTQTQTADTDTDIDTVLEDENWLTILNKRALPKVRQHSMTVISASVRSSKPARDSKLLIAGKHWEFRTRQVGRFPRYVIDIHRVG